VDLIEDGGRVLLAVRGEQTRVRVRLTLADADLDALIALLVRARRHGRSGDDHGATPSGTLDDD
jgi:hypothetical protein